MDCLGKVSDYAKETGQKFDKRKLEEYARRFEQLSKNRPDMTKAEIYQMIGDIIESDHVLQAEKVRAAKIQNLKAIAEGVELIRDTRYSKDPIANIHALLTGTSSKVVKGGNKGIRAMGKALAGRWMNELMYAVEGHIPELSRGGLDRDLVYALNDLPAVDGQPVSPTAQKIAGAYNAIMAKVFDQKKAVNPFIERIQDYFVKQTHSREKVGAVKFDEWETDVRRAFGAKSFPDLEDAEISVKLANIYHAIVNDEYSSSFVKKPGDKMASMTRERTLIPNDAESFYQYQKKYGEGNIFETMQKTIRQASHDIAVVQRLGSEPVENFNRMVKTAMRGADEKTVARYENHKPLIQAELQTALGFSSAPAKNMIGKATQFVMSIEAASKLSGVFLSLMDDVGRALSFGEYTTGENPVKTTGQLTYHYMNGLISKEYAKEAARYVGIFLDSLHGYGLSEMGSVDHAPGVLGKLNKTMSKLAFMEQHHRGAATSMGIMLASAAADNAHLEFEAVNPFIRHGMLERYGLDAHDWNNVIRNGVQDVSEISKATSLGKLVTMEGIESVPDEAFSKSLQARGVEEPTARDIQQERTRVVTAWGSMINDLADVGSSTAGTAEFAKLHRGVDINNPLGAAARVAFLFKTATLKNLNSTKRLFYSGADPLKGNWSGVAKLVGYGVVAYAMKRWVQDAISGKTPSDPTNIKGFVAPALASAIGGGPAVDMFMHVFQQDYNQFGFKGQLATAIGGPVVGDALDYADLAAMVGNYPIDKARVQPEDIAGKLGRLAIASPLGAPLKLPYTKSIADYYIVNELRQVGNARYLRNLQRKMDNSGGMATDAGLWPRQEYFMLDPRYK